MTSAATGGLSVGDLLAGRYLLVEAVGGAGGTTLWRAEDEVLARTVAVRVLPAPTKAAKDGAQPLLDAAVASGRVNHPGLARVFDAAVEKQPGRGRDVVYVLREWVDGEPLDAHLEAVGALAGPDAADVVRQLADALTALHRGGLVHGRLHPGNVVVTPTGRVRITDACVGAALAETPPSHEADDTRDLGAVLYALVTGRWPAPATPQPAGSLTPAPVTDGHPLSPRQLRAGVNRALDTTVLRALLPLEVPSQAPLRTPAALADAADAAVAETREALAAAAAPAGPPAPSRLRRAVPWVLALAFLAAAGVVGYQAGLGVGELKPRSDVDALVTATQAPTPGVAAPSPLDLSKVVVTDFDPQGDKQESGDKVRNAVDGFPDTTWPTSRYRSATFGGLKSGVGLLLDLGSVRPIAGVQVGFSAPGAQVELRTADPAATSAPTTLEQTTAVAAARDGKQVAALTPAPGTKARWVVVWVTSLPKDGDGYRVGISELRIT